MTGRGAHRRDAGGSRRRPLVVGLLLLATVVAVLSAVLAWTGTDGGATGRTAAPPSAPPALAAPVDAPRAVAPPDAGAMQVRIDQVTAARPLRFVGDGVVMTPDGVRTIDQLAVMLLSNPNLSVTVTGHTVMVGTDLGWCQRLSELRADAVAERLQTYGIAPSRLHTRGVSHHQPLDSPTASRRADVVVHA